MGPTEKEDELTTEQVVRTREFWQAAQTTADFCEAMANVQAIVNQPRSAFRDLERKMLDRAIKADLDFGRD